VSQSPSAILGGGEVDGCELSALGSLKVSKRSPQSGCLPQNGQCLPQGSLPGKALHT
jgi:hypothetical protein